MTKLKSIDVAAMIEQTQNSKEKEVYIQLEKTPACRIGVGARANPPTSTSFFLEVIINLSSGNGQVNLQRLENTLTCLKALKARGYSLTYEDSNCISCETTTTLENPNEEYQKIKSLIEEAHI